jgi:hypothetical protein
MANPSDIAALGTLDENNKIAKHGELSFELTLPKDEDSYGGWWISVYSLSRLETARASDSEMRSISTSRSPNASTDPASSPSPDLTKQTPFVADSRLGYDPTNWTFTNVQGRVFSNAVFSSFNPAWVIVMVKGESYRFYFTNLPPESRAIFHYDQAKADAYLDQLAAPWRASSAAWSAQQLAKARAAKSAQLDSETSPTPDTTGGGGYVPTGGSVYVRGYTRKDGTYVNSYTRSR